EVASARSSCWPTDSVICDRTPPKEPPGVARTACGAEAEPTPFSTTVSERRDRALRAEILMIESYIMCSSRDRWSWKSAHGLVLRPANWLRRNDWLRACPPFQRPC